MRGLKILSICLAVFLTSSDNHGRIRPNEYLLITNHMKAENYKKIKKFYLNNENAELKLDEAEIRAFSRLEKRGYLLYNDIRFDGDESVLYFLGCSKRVKFRIGRLDLKTGAIEHILTDVYLDGAGREKLISLDAQNNPYVLMRVYPRGGAHGMFYWSIIDINDKKEVFIHPQKIRRFEDPVNYRLKVSEEYFNDMKVIYIYDGEKTPAKTFRWNPVKKEYTDRVFESSQTNGIDENESAE